jgi:hypothetical protein
MKVGIDIDGVCASFFPAVIERFGTPVSNAYSLEQMFPDRKREVWDFVDSPGTYDNLLPLPGAAETTLKLSSEHDLVFITARPKHTAPNTIQWLRRNRFPEVDVIHSNDKVAVALLLGLELFIEDNLWTARRLARHMPCILFNWTYNQGDYSPRVNDWSEIGGYFG